MGRREYVSGGVVLAVVLMVIVTIQPYGYPSSSPIIRPFGNLSSQSPMMAPNPLMSGPNTARPQGMNVSVIGTIKTYKVAPVCSLSNPPCAIFNTVLYYVVVNGRDYRLIFPNGTQSLPSIGSYVVVTGLYITPSTYQASQYTPYLQFYGDIVVTVISYFQDFPR